MGQPKNQDHAEEHCLPFTFVHSGVANGHGSAPTAPYMNVGTFKLVHAVTHLL